MCGRYTINDNLKHRVHLRLVVVFVILVRRDWWKGWRMLRFASSPERCEASRSKCAMSSGKTES